MEKAGIIRPDQKPHYTREHDMKTNTTYISAALIAQIVEQSNLPTVDKKGWLLVGNFDTNGPRVYIPKTKKVGRIDLSGFELDSDAVNKLGGASFGAVHQQLRFDLPEAVVLSNLQQVLEELKALPKFQKVLKTPKAGETPKPAAPSTPAEARKQAILDAANKLIAEGMAPMTAITQARASVDASIAASSATEPAAEPSSS